MHLNDTQFKLIMRIANVFICFFLLSFLFLLSLSLSLNVFRKNGFLIHKHFTDTKMYE